jgi:hypothetical protein
MKCKTYDIRTHTMYKKLRFTNWSIDNLVNLWYDISNVL